MDNKRVKESLRLSGPHFIAIPSFMLGATFPTISLISEICDYMCPSLGSFLTFNASTFPWLLFLCTPSASSQPIPPPVIPVRRHSPGGTETTFPEPAVYLDKEVISKEAEFGGRHDV